jgi:hypothetical protein
MDIFLPIIALVGDIQPLKDSLLVVSLQFKPQTCPLTLRVLMSYIYGVHILDVSRSHTTTHHSR